MCWGKPTSISTIDEQATERAERHQRDHHGQRTTILVASSRQRPRPGTFTSTYDANGQTLAVTQTSGANSRTIGSTMTCWVAWAANRPLLQSSIGTEPVARESLVQKAPTTLPSSHAGQHRLPHRADDPERGHDLLPWWYVGHRDQPDAVRPTWTRHHGADATGPACELECQRHLAQLPTDAVYNDVNSPPPPA